MHLLRVAYRQVADAVITAQHTNPKRARSIRAVLDALALVNVTRSGSIAQRQLAECAAVSRSSVVVVLAELIEWGIIERAHRYAEGAQDSDAYQPGRLAREALEAIRTTRSVTPPPPPGHRVVRGTAHVPTMKRRHRKEQGHWRLHCAQAAECHATGERYADSSTPAAKKLRSLYVQRRRWEAVPDEEKEARREARRALLRTLSPGERAAWFDWLARRELLAKVAHRVRTGVADEADHQTIAAAPNLLHLGMRDPAWREGGTRTPRPANSSPSPSNGSCRVSRVGRLGVW